LKLRVIQQPAITRTVVTLGEVLLKTLDIQTPYPRFAPVYPAEKPHLSVVGKKIHDFVVLRFVDEEAVGVLDAADLMNVLLDGQLVLESFHSRGEGGD